MTILLADAPDAARRAVLDGISKRYAARGFWTPKLRNANPKALQLCAPHRFGFLSLGKLKKLSELRYEASLRAVTRMLGWRFLIFETNNMGYPLAAAHAVLTESGEYRLSELNEGPFVGNTLTAFERMSLEIEENPPTEVLLLLAPAVYFVGLWVRYQREADDLILPVDPVSGGLRPFVPMKPAELLPVLYDAAKKIPAHGTSAG